MVLLQKIGNIMSFITYFNRLIQTETSEERICLKYISDLVKPQDTIVKIALFDVAKFRNSYEFTKDMWKHESYEMTYSFTAKAEKLFMDAILGIQIKGRTDL